MVPLDSRQKADGIGRRTMCDEFNTLLFFVSLSHSLYSSFVKIPMVYYLYSDLHKITIVVVGSIVPQDVGIHDFFIPDLDVLVAKASS